MEINVTEFVKLGDMKYYFGTRAEFGDDAAQITWENSFDKSEDFDYVTEENKREIISYFLEFGVWTHKVMADWSVKEVQAVLLQMIAGDMREFSDDPIEEWDWEEYQRQSEQGRVSGNLHRGVDGQYYFYAA